MCEEKIDYSKKIKTTAFRQIFSSMVIRELSAVSSFGPTAKLLLEIALAELSGTISKEGLSKEFQELLDVCPDDDEKPSDEPVKNSEGFYPCIRCGCHSIAVVDKPALSGRNIGGMCRNCEKTCTINDSGGDSKEIWNAKNDPRHPAPRPGSFTIA